MRSAACSAQPLPTFSPLFAQCAVRCRVEAAGPHFGSGRAGPTACSIPPTSAPGLGRPRPLLPAHICFGTWLTHAQICTGTGLTLRRLHLSAQADQVQRPACSFTLRSQQCVHITHTRAARRARAHAHAHKPLSRCRVHGSRSGGISRRRETSSRCGASCGSKTASSRSSRGRCATVA